MKIYFKHTHIFFKWRKSVENQYYHTFIWNVSIFAYHFHAVAVMVSIVWPVFTCSALSCNSKVSIVTLLSYKLTQAHDLILHLIVLSFQPKSAKNKNKALRFVWDVKWSHWNVFWVGMRNKWHESCLKVPLIMEIRYSQFVFYQQVITFFMKFGK